MLQHLRAMRMTYGQPETNPQNQCAHEEGERLESMLDGMICSIRKKGER